MIREYKDADRNSIMKLWLNTNIQSHSFISEEYWRSHYDMVKEMLPKAELYVYEDDTSGTVEGFIGLTGDYIAGIFVRGDVQSKGIGKQLLDHAKMCKTGLSLKVYRRNERAVRFYLREQFVVDSESIDEDTYEKEFVMKWDSSGICHTQDMP